MKRYYIMVSISIQHFINWIIVLVVTIVFGYLLGLSVTKTVNHQLSDISINFPKINLPKQHITLNLDKANQLQVDNQFTSKNHNDMSDRSNMSYYQQTGGFHDRIPPQIVNKDFIRPSRPDKLYQDQTASHHTSRFTTQLDDADNMIHHTHGHQRVNQLCCQQNHSVDKLNKPHCSTHADCNVIDGNNHNQCLSNHRCHCLEGAGSACAFKQRQHQSNFLTYYKDPHDMTARQLYKFKTRAKFNKMTIQDYINWLLLFVHESENLSVKHLHNLNKVKNQQSLTIHDMPTNMHPPPFNAQDYYDQLYRAGPQSIPQKPIALEAAVDQQYGNLSELYTQESQPLQDRQHDRFPLDELDYS